MRYPSLYLSARDPPERPKGVSPWRGFVPSIPSVTARHGTEDQKCDRRHHLDEKRPMRGCDAANSRPQFISTSADNPSNWITSEWPTNLPVMRILGLWVLSRSNASWSNSAARSDRYVSGTTSEFGDDQCDVVV